MHYGLIQNQVVVWFGWHGSLFCSAVFDKLAVLHIALQLWHGMSSSLQDVEEMSKDSYMYVSCLF